MTYNEIMAEGGELSRLVGEMPTRSWDSAELVSFGRDSGGGFVPQYRRVMYTLGRGEQAVTFGGAHLPL